MAEPLEGVERAELEFLRDENKEWARMWTESTRLLWDCQRIGYQKSLKEFFDKF